MGGFVGGIYSKHRVMCKKIEQKVKEMTSVISRKSPENEVYYFDEYIHCGSCGRDEPLTFENERYWICLNGKIYNHLELRQELIEKKHVFSTNLEAETLLALYSELNDGIVQKIRGDFGFVIWDKQERKLFGARDPFGIKPFYFLELDEITYFSSDKQCLVLIENMEIDTDAVQHYFSFQYVPEPSTMTRKVRKLSPGYYFTKCEGREMKVKCYWKPNFKPVLSAESQAIKEIHNVLTNSITLHMQGDLPIGAFLSGGIDSSIIVSLAKQVNPRLKTFTVGFEREGFSEVSVAQQTANELQLDNISYIISPEEFIKELPKIVWHLGNPMADPSAVPLYFAAREAKKHVGVVLSGEGADELFGGYNIYLEPHSLRVFNYIPQRLKTLLGVISRILPGGIKGKSFIERGITPLEKRYIGNAKIFDEVEKSVLLQSYRSAIHYTHITKPIYDDSMGYDAVTKMQNIDIHTWLRGDILVKADRMSMAHCLEVRLPFLDKKVFDTASKLRTDEKVRNNVTKYLLRKAAEGLVPDHVLNRRKLGFPVPIGHWLKDEIYDWAVQLIRSSETDYILNKNYIETLFDDHLLNKKDNSRKLWTILIFMLWHQIYVEGTYETYVIGE
ncbi:asparagine synthase (glutamine-hydrolyzing) [Sporosarcina sp. Marseille-Q4063]|uniref:asparagine synthase (glutamine-hydrolyzing) n=1 Tax=Sporosarcina sp. Marseille-Q4063 TaxID=2810514 RepID=UPI001BAF849C|nr:asparagine synthase (glutamine-hydrolyzing) [Sporosarcina sp. Marseille-Q4063]QUW22044.1 asparagine synthase (glutamine-hydrolyzing) [Sporosarcina sp. Marseille-Q4063]